MFYEKTNSLNIVLVNNPPVLLEKIRFAVLSQFIVFSLTYRLRKRIQLFQSGQINKDIAYMQLIKNITVKLHLVWQSLFSDPKGTR